MLCLVMTLVCNVAWADIDADGAVVTFTNVQQDGKEYALYINESNTLAVSTQSAAELGETAQFRATKMESGKWTFYNEAKQLYMIWRGNNSGYNGNSGVLGEYNATYCDWTLVSGDGSKVGTHYMVSKRSDGTTDGSVVIMNGGSFDKFDNNVGWASNYSNLYRIDIVALAPNTVEYVYNVTDGAYAGSGWCAKWTSNNAAMPSLAIAVDVNNVNGGQTSGIGLRPGKSGSATYNVNAGCTMLSLSFEAKGTNNHKIVIGGMEYTVGTEWKKFVINDINATTAQFGLKDDNNNDCLLRNVRIITPVLPIKAEIEGSWENNPNTHFGRVRATNGDNVATINLTTAHLATTYMHYSGGNEVIDFTRPYRGFEFLGYYVDGEAQGTTFTLTDDLNSRISAENPLVAKFKATDAVTLFYDDDEYSYRIPAIGKTSTGRLIAVSDYRYSLDDIGRYNFGTANPGIDLVIRMSDDNGKTWSETKTIAKCSGVRGTDDCAYGDAAIAVVGEKVLVMGAAGDVMFGNGSATAHNRTVRIISEDGGENWTNPEDISETFFINADATINSAYSLFFGSGKLAVDENYNNTGKARIYGAVLVRKNGIGNGIYVVYTDDFGLTWSILGGSQTHITANDEPKVEILPSGQILLSVRRGGGRQFNVFTYTDKATNAGSWNTNVNGCDNGGSNTCNGEIYLVDAKKADGAMTKLLLQSQPKGGGGLYDRRDVTIWYTEISNAAYTSSEIAGNWIEGMQVSTQLSAYSTMVMQNDGKMAFFFEEAPCYGDDYTKGYSMVYMPLTIENITKGNYFSEDADLSAEHTINVVLTDEQGNEYRDQVQSGLTGVADAITGKYAFITLGNQAGFSFENGSYTYTNSVTLPFKVSNEETTVWYNIYWPANGDGESERFPVYLSASTANDEFVPKVTEYIVYGNSSYNTLDNADKISWAVYSVDNGFTFKFKNKLTGKFIQATGVAGGNAQNVKYVDEANATAFELDLVKQGNKCYGDYALKADVGGTTGYLCSTSAKGYHYATHYSGKGHPGAWFKFAEAPDYAALIASITEPLASGRYGDGFGQYKPTGDTDLAAIRTAMESSSSVKLNTLNSYKALLDAATLNMPQSGQFFRVAYDYGNAGKLYMQSTASSVKGLQFAAETGAASIWVYYDGALYSYAAGQCLREHGDDRGLQAVGGKTTATFSASTRAKGKYNIVCGSYVHANSSNGSYYTDHCSGNNHETHDLILEEVDALPITIAAIGYGTLYAPVALSIPEGVKAYAGMLNDAQDELTLTEVETIPANTGVVLYRAEGSEATNYEFEITTGVAAVESHLVGNVATTAKSGNPYTLQTHDYDSDGTKEGVAFKMYTGTNPINGFKAYLNLTMESTAEARAVRIRFASDEDNEGGTTNVEETTANGQQPIAIYDLMGRRVEQMVKGHLYIVNGKKVIF